VDPLTAHAAINVKSRRLDRVKARETGIGDGRGRISLKGSPGHVSKILVLAGVTEFFHFDADQDAAHRLMSYR
jgi:hypothetical protein